MVVKACLSRIRSERTYTGRDVGEAQLAGDVVAALADLPEALRVPLVLRCYAGLSEKEIAVAIDRRPGTVRSRLYDARQRLALDPRLAAWVLPQEAAQ